MKKEDQNKETKKRKEKADRLRSLIGIDLCACGPLNHLKCHNACRKAHKDQHGQVVCTAKYQIDPAIFNFKKQKRKGKQKGENVGPKQDWHKKQNRHRD